MLDWITRDHVYGYCWGAVVFCVVWLLIDAFWGDNEK